MLTENDQQTPPAASQAAPAEQPANAAPTFTAEQVVEREQRAAQKAHDAAMAEARRIFEGKQKAASNAQQPTATQPQQQATQTGEDFTRYRVFDRTVARYDITDDAMAILDEDFARAKPADVGGWVAQRMAAFGVKQRGATPTPTSTPVVAVTAPATQAPNAQPVTGHAAPSNSATVITDDVPLLNRSESQRQDFIKQHGWMKYTDRMREEAMRNQSRLRVPR